MTSVSGRCIRLVAGSDCRLSGPCLAQHGCSSPQGALPAGNLTNAGRMDGMRIPGQQECWCGLAAGGRIASAFNVPACSVHARATGTLHEVSAISTKAAMNRFCMPRTMKQLLRMT